METLLASIIIFYGIKKEDMCMNKKTIGVKIDFNFDIIKFFINCSTIGFYYNASQAIVLCR